MAVLIAGGGIAGLTLGLTLHQIGVPFRIYEKTGRYSPLGVGINLQPNAVRELYDLGLKPMLDKVGIRTQEYGFFSKSGREIWVEQRGKWAGYRWPQYSIHRGKLQMALLEALIERAGPECVVTGHKALGFSNCGSAGELALECEEGVKSVVGDLVIGADGIHSAIRAQMYPDEGAPIWNGAILWRGTTMARPFRTGASMALAGHDNQRIVLYPISTPNSETGLAMINWIAELRVDPAQALRKEDWNRPADLAEFLPAFEHWQFDWLDVPALIRGADKVYEYPMVDRDPVDRWTDGHVTLMGDAAHPTYPVGSNGASQGIVDARVIGAGLLAHGVSPDALHAYEEKIRPLTRNIQLANRGSGPDKIMQIVEDRCGGVFDSIGDVISNDELSAHAASYKSLAGFGIDALNASPPTIDTRLLY
ncbi:MAG TPA: flavin-dependent oxidoreductase [Woeseiaceae bacterium]|nr:flavin-dependent oxidoreductase [Woeseiaceae bacterium]